MSELPPVDPQDITQPVSIRQGRKWRQLRRDVIQMVLMALIVYMLMNVTTARAYILGPSMQPNFFAEQRLIGDRLSYYFSDPMRGDVIILHDPHTGCETRVGQRDCEDLLKRVIGLPGETVQINQGRVYINGLLLD